MEPHLDFIPEDQRIAQLLIGTVGLLETAFPNRIRAYYLTGSYAEETAVAHSDLDLIIVFQGDFQNDEADRLRQIRYHASKISLMRLDLTPKSEANLFSKGATGLKMATQFLYGEDIRERVPFESIEQYRQDVIRGFLIYQREIRGEPDQLPSPLTYPDADAEFFGYETYGLWHGGVDFEPGTRLLINLITVGATASLTALHGQRAGSKKQAIEKYQRLIGDKWGDWLAELYQLAKLDLGYALPQDTAVRQKLRRLIQPTLEYENLILERCDPYLNSNCTSNLQ
jgi:hypothetical protein